MKKLMYISVRFFLLVYKIPLLSNATAMKSSYQQCRSAIYEAVSSVTIFYYYFFTVTCVEKEEKEHISLPR